MMTAENNVGRLNPHIYNNVTLFMHFFRATICLWVEEWNWVEYLVHTEIGDNTDFSAWGTMEIVEALVSTETDKQ